MEDSHEAKRRGSGHGTFANTAKADPEPTRNKLFMDGGHLPQDLLFAEEMTVG